MLLSENTHDNIYVQLKILREKKNIKPNPGVSIKFEVGSWLEKNNRLHEQGTAP